MRRKVLWILLIGSLGGLSYAVVGCRSGETISERRRRASLELAKLRAEDMRLEEEPESAAGAPEAAPAPEKAETKKPVEASRGIVSSQLAEEKLAAAESSPAGRAKPASESDAESVLDRLREDRAAQAAEAQYYKERGDMLFGQQRFEEAYDAYRRALERDPLLEPARQRLNETGLILGVRTGEIPAISNTLRQERQVREELQRAETERLLARAEEAFRQKNMDEAERAAQRAVDAVRAQPDLDAATRQRAEDLLTTIRQEKRRLEEERREELLRQAKGAAERDLEEERAIRYQTVQRLLRKARDLMEIREYQKAIEICERVLQLDPENLVAKYWIADGREQLIKQRRFRLLEDRLENEKLAEEAFAQGSIPYNDIFVFPEADYWQEVVRKRSESVSILATEDPEWVRRIKNALEGTRVNLLFDNTPLDDAVQQIRTFTGMPIMIDPQVDSKSLQVTMNLQGLTAGQALRHVLDNVGLEYTFKENVLFITSPGQQAGRAEFAIYNISDILNKIRNFAGPEIALKPRTAESSASVVFQQGALGEEEEEMDPDRLIQLIKDSSGGEEAWGNYSMEHHSGQLLVNAPRELHAEVQKVLANLRKDSDLFVVIEARFIDINDDFLEDIGIDSRSLAAGNNLGTAWGNVINNTQTGGRDLGFTERYTTSPSPELVMGQDRWAGRIQHILDGFTGTIRGRRLTGGAGVGGLTLQSTWLEPFQLNVILRAVQERNKARQLTAPVVTAHNGQRVYVSVVTQRAYIADYNLVSGGTGYSIIEVADPEVATFQEGVILDVNPVISPDRKYITMDVRPTLATLIGGVISTILISLGSFTNVAFQVPIGVPQISLQQSYTSVTVPNGGTVLLGGFKSMSESKYTSYIPLLGKIPLLNNLFRRKATLSEKRSLIILITGRIVDLRGEEAQKFNPE